MSQSLPDGLLVAWYGDDFTGSSAVMEVLSFAGLPSVLFLEPPSADDLARFPNLRGIGIASTARAQSPEWMDSHLPGPFGWMKQSDAPICHYKTCSTFDSAPHVGSIGRAGDIGAAVFGDPLIPLFIAAPAIRRYQAFGHLFAGAGEKVYRLDRHPVMACHPVTPMPESDLTKHLACQTKQRIGLVDLEALACEATTKARLEALLAQGPAIVAIDTMNEDDLARAGALLWNNRHRGRFVLGSQGVEYALIAYFRQQGWLGAPPVLPSLAAVPCLPVVSGSVSPITAQQIDHAEAHGFKVIALPSARLLAGANEAKSAIEATIGAALNCLDASVSPLICSARGPDDPAVAAFRAARIKADLSEAEANGAIGAALGTILEAIIAASGVRRAVVSGGDTSGEVTKRLGVRALTAFAATTPGAALFKAYRDNNRPTIELALKGGQMGATELFATLRDGLA